jgi:hypothetical protein
MTSAGARCRHCGQPIDPVQQHGKGICGASACRATEDRLRTERLQATTGAAAMSAASSELGGRPAALVWLQPAQTELVPVPEARRRAHRDHLDFLIAAEASGDACEPLAEAPAASGLGAQEHLLCTQCGGRCCHLGAGSNAFMTLPQLLRWQTTRPGRSVAEAAEWFMHRIPDRHVRSSCIYHGAEGCTLPREQRPDICNAYACATLHEVQAGLRQDVQTAFVAVTYDGGRVLRRAVIDVNGLVPLPDE